MDDQIRRIRASEWQELRSLRLQALTEAPTAFGSTLAQEQIYPEEVGRERALGSSSGCDRATFVAHAGGVWIGVVTGLANQFTSASAVPLLVAMFVVAPERRRGFGVRLVDTVAAWAQECGHSQLALWVTSDNASAVALYERCNFRFSGAIKPHSHAHGLVEKEMMRHLQEAKSCQ
jgi:GNAT superfamily N-acetyltransferase